MFCLLAAPLAPVLAQPTSDRITELPGERRYEIPEPRQPLPQASPEGAVMRERVYSTLAEAQACADRGDAVCARRLADNVRGMNDLNAYETAQLWSFYGYLYASMDNVREASRAYETVLQQPGLPAPLLADTMERLSRLYYQLEQYQASLDTLNDWFTVTDSITPEAHILKAQLHFRLRQFREGVPAVEAALDLAWSQSVRVQEEWYQLLNALYYELEDYANMVRVLRIMFANWPKREYVIQLASLYAQEGDEERQLAFYEIAYESGWLTRSSELVNYSQMLLQANIPYKAARILEQGLADGSIEPDAIHWRLLAQAWQLAHEDEKAVPALTHAASLTQDGNLDVRLAESYQTLEQWQECAAAARTGLNKGGLRRPDFASMVLGACLFELKQYEGAAAAFREAASDTRSAEAAQNWLRYMDAERDRERQLAQALQRG